MKIYPNSDAFQLTAPSHPIFQYVEKRFWNWINGAPRDVREMYFSEDAIYEKKGAIQGAIENAIEAANEENKPIDLRTFDIECAFE
jgi:hypothetical protein